MRLPLTVAAVTAAAFAAFAAPAVHAQPSIATSFTYQGRLLDGDVPANGLFDFSVSLWDAATDGTQIGTTNLFPGTDVGAGLVEFELDFGASVFNGEARWLEVAVGPAGTRGALTTLAPRRAILPAPQARYALLAESAVNDAVDDADADATNELQNLSSTAFGIDRTVMISDGASTTFNVADNDNSSTNEIQTLSFATPNLTLSNGGGMVSLAPLVASLGDGHSLDADDMDPIDALYVDADGRVGIGTGTPQAGLHVVTAGPSEPFGEAGVLRDASTGGTATQLGGTVDVKVVGTVAYVVSTGDDSLTTIDISNPASPTELDTIWDNFSGGTATGLRDANGVDAIGSTVYTIGFNDDTLSIFDVSNPSSISQIGTIVDGGGAAFLNGPTDLMVIGSRVYLSAQEENSLAIYDVSNPASITELGGIRDNEAGGTATQLEDASGIFVVGNTAYVTADADDALSIFGVSDPSNITELGAITDNNLGGAATGLNGANDVIVVGDYAFVTSLEGLSVLDVSDPSNIAEVTVVTSATAPGLGGATGLALSGSTLYVSGNSADGFAALDISNPASPVHLFSIRDDNQGGTATTLNAPNGIDAVGGAVYTTSLVESGFSIFDSAPGLSLLVEGEAAKDTGAMWSVYSDARLKRDIHPLAGSLERILALRPVGFRFSEAWEAAFGRPAPAGEQAGFLAQEYQQVFPRDVRRDAASGYLAIDPSSTLPDLVGAVQEQQRELDRVNAENAELRARLDALEAKLTQQ